MASAGCGQPPLPLLCAGMSLLWEGQPTMVVSPHLPLSHCLGKMRRPLPSQPTKRPPARNKRLSDGPGSPALAHMDTNGLDQHESLRINKATTPVTLHQWLHFLSTQQCSVVLMSCFVLQSVGSCAPCGRWLTCSTSATHGLRKKLLYTKSDVVNIQWCFTGDPKGPP